MIKTCLIFCLFSGALLFGLKGVPYMVSWTKLLIGEALMLKMAGYMMFVGFVGFFTCLCTALISIIKSED